MQKHILPKYRFQLAYCLLALALLSGCAHHNAATPPADNRLRISMESSPTTFDNAVLQDVYTTQMLQQVYEGLVQYDEKNNIVPCLAAKWDISPDGKTYTFHLHPGVRFQNGQPLTADDVAFSLARPLDKTLGSPVALTYLGDIVGAQDVADDKTQALAGVKVLDPQTVSVTITKPKAYWIDTLTYPTSWILCKSAVSKLGRRRLTDADLAQGITTGPFKLTHYEKDHEVDMDANPAYWDGKPTIAGQRHIIATDTGTRHALFVSGQLDIMRGEEFGDLRADKTNPALKDSIHIWPRATTMYLNCNENAYPPFKDVRVRQAFAYATDKERLKDVVTQGAWNVAPTLLPVGIPGTDPNYQGLPYDPAKGRALLAAAGYPGGKGLPPLPIYYNEKTVYSRTTVDLLRQMYTQNLGAPVQPTPLEWGTLLQQINKNTIIPSSSLAWVADYLDPQDFYSLLLTSNSPENHNGFHDPQFDTLCAQADVMTDSSKRFALYQQIGKLATAQSSRIPLLYESDPELIKPYVHGMQDCLMGHLPFKKVSFAKP